MTETPRSHLDARALILGGGGAGGNAWEIGVIAGLFEAGLDVTGADLIVGTSAGSTAAVQISGPTRPPELLAAILAAVFPPRTRPAGAGGGPPRTRPAGAGVGFLDKSRAVIAAAADAADMRRAMGAAALELDAGPGRAGQDGRRAAIAARLPGASWPDQAVLVVAVDAESGDPVVFDRHSGVELVDAVGASTAGPGGPPWRIRDHRYIDGGYRRNENADLAAGYGRVLVLSPFSGRSLTPPAWGMQLAAQVDELRAAGSRVEAVFPDDASRTALGIQPDGTSSTIVDPSTRPAAARAGYDQGRVLAGRLTEFWR